MKTGIIIQARMGSTRLPGKILKKLAGKEVLWHVVERCRRSRMAQELIVATSHNPADNQIFDFCRKEKIKVFRGSLNNVLLRYYECAKNFGLDTIVRVTSDCPLIDPFIIDECVKLFESSDKDYVSNCLTRVFPRGLDCEVFSFSALEEAASQADTDHDREHVTSYIIKNKNSLPYRVGREYQGDFRLTLDVDNDYDLLNLIYNKFYCKNEIIDVRGVINFLRNNPKVARINFEVEQKSLATN